MGRLRVKRAIREGESKRQTFKTLVYPKVVVFMPQVHALTETTLEASHCRAGHVSKLLNSPALSLNK